MMAGRGNKAALETFLDIAMDRVGGKALAACLNQPCGKNELSAVDVASKSSPQLLKLLKSYGGVAHSTAGYKPQQSQQWESNRDRSLPS